MGTWNPFVPYHFQEGQSSSSLTQLITILFVVCLFVSQKLQKEKNNDFAHFLIVLFLIILLSTILNSLSVITFETLMFFIKFAIVLTLCCLLPRLFVYSPKLIYQSIFIFSIVCTILSIAYALGYLDFFVYIKKGRFYFWGENANSTSARYGLAFLFIIHIIVNNPLELSKWRHLLWLSLPFILNLIMATGSRGSFLILLISIITYFAFVPIRNKNNKWILILFLSIGLYWSIVYISSNNQEYSLFDRINKSFVRGDDAGREELNEKALEIFMDNPIYGVGIQDFQDEMMARFHENRTVHNLYFYLLAISGILGFGCFAAFLFYLLRKAFATRRYTSLALALFLYMFLLASKTGGILTYIMMWYVFSIIISLAVINANIIDKQRNEINSHSMLVEPCKRR
jgi:O-antigen ligase